MLLLALLSRRRREFVDFMDSGVDIDILDEVDTVVIVEDGEGSSNRHNLSAFFFEVEDDLEIFLVFEEDGDPGLLLSWDEFRLRDVAGL